MRCGEWPFDGKAAAHAGEPRCVRRVRAGSTHLHAMQHASGSLSKKRHGSERACSDGPRGPRLPVAAGAAETAAVAVDTTAMAAGVTEAAGAAAAAVLAAAAVVTRAAALVTVVCDGTSVGGAGGDGGDDGDGGGGVDGDADGGDDGGGSGGIGGSGGGSSGGGGGGIEACTRVEQEGSGGRK